MRRSTVKLLGFALMCLLLAKPVCTFAAESPSTKYEQQEEAKEIEDTPVPLAAEIPEDLPAVVQIEEELVPLAETPTESEELVTIPDEDTPLAESISPATGDFHLEICVMLACLGMSSTVFCLNRLQKLTENR